MKKSCCRVCSSRCGVELRVEANAITGMRGDRDNSSSQGYFCIKGKNAIDWHNGQDRLRTPRRRTNDGRHVAIAADDAIDQIHSRLGAIIERHGPGAVAVYHGTGLHPTNPAFIHPDDLLAEKLRDGDLVRIASASGSVVARVKGDRSLRRGTLAMTHCWGRVEQDADRLGDEGAFTGRLVDAQDRQAINFMPTQTAVPVSVEALAATQPTSAENGFRVTQ